MCDCPALPCMDCSRTLPVHIADFCVPRDTVEVRCEEHPPPEPDGWMAFDGCDEEDGTPLYTMYMRCTATQDQFGAANQRAIESRKRMRERYPGLLPPIVELPDPAYALGDEGGICPNLGGDYSERWVTEPYDGRQSQ